MTPTLAAVVPVKDGARYLHEVLSALAARGRRRGAGRSTPARATARWRSPAGPARRCWRSRRPSSATDARATSRRSARTRRSSPSSRRTPRRCPGGATRCWRRSRSTRGSAPSFGPHLPRPGTSPMIARELTEFFATFAADGDAPHVVRPRRARRSSPTSTPRTGARAGTSSGSTTCPTARTRRSAARSRIIRRWRKAYVPRAGVLHAHDYPPLEFMRRYFDEYRGLRETIGHVERIGVRSTIRDVRGLVAHDRRWMREQGMAPRRGHPLDRPLPAAPRWAEGVLGAREPRQRSCRPPSSARCRWRAAPTAPRRGRPPRRSRTFRAARTSRRASRPTATRRSPA